MNQVAYALGVGYASLISWQWCLMTQLSNYRFMKMKEDQGDNKRTENMENKGIFLAQVFFILN